MAASSPSLVRAIDLPVGPDARLYLAWAHSLRGDLEAADRIYRELLAEDEKEAGAILLPTYGWNLAQMGKGEGVAEMLRLVSQSPSVEIDPYPLAILYAGMGDRENALLAVERAFAQRSPNMIYLGIEPFLDPIRGQARFESLKEQLSL